VEEKLITTIHRSVRYWAFAKFTIDFAEFALHAVGGKKTPTAAQKRQLLALKNSTFCPITYYVIEKLIAVEKGK